VNFYLKKTRTKMVTKTKNNIILKKRIIKTPFHHFLNHPPFFVIQKTQAAKAKKPPTHAKNENPKYEPNFVHTI
jgi:hypothetical protein